ncbi:MAG TPA: hypothetical protein DEF45_10755, partial [Rhodopirellula sp.]|nr:hypothetical protein [Rhodopirellula sp.]
CPPYLFRRTAHPQRQKLLSCTKPDQPKPEITGDQGIPTGETRKLQNRPTANAAAGLAATNAQVAAGKQLRQSRPIHSNLLWLHNRS